MFAVSDPRPPAVAGLFYPAEPTRLRAVVDECLAEADGSPAPHLAAIVPHAGLIYSGPCAARVFAQLVIPPVTVILAPNHTGQMSGRGGASLAPHHSFMTPLGEVSVAAEFGDRLMETTDLVGRDADAHRREHAIEVELPFLRTLAPHTHIVPIVLAWDDWSRCEELASALVSVIRDWPEDVLLVASSDMTHYESADSARDKDRYALEAMERLQPEELLAACRREQITMCGRAPAAVAIAAARELGATAGRVVDYRHSGWVTGDDSSVVAYAGVLIR